MQTTPPDHTIDVRNQPDDTPPSRSSPARSCSGGAVAVRDELRPESAEVEARLHTEGYTVAMLTGDNARTATALAKAAGIDSVHADLRTTVSARRATGRL